MCNLAAVDCESCDCDEDHRSITGWTITNHLGKPETVHTCPRRAVSESSRDFCRLYSHYSNGFLYTAGGVGAQPAIYLEAMRVIEGRIGLIEQQRMDEMRKRHGR